ncbi:hypothetical protein [Limosilactobacillus fermentum]|uniref:hypothetical protein n=1 Tax=Limosilactobacillus fermentum TaxID=1613 RepID=UPI0021CB55CB|nr:hypothetical protein [Limosilactobacillus fermentum]
MSATSCWPARLTGYLLTAPVRRLTVTLTQTLYFIGALVVTFGSMTVTSLLVNHYAEAGFAKKILVELNFGALAIAFAFAGIMFLASGVFNLSKLSLGTGGGLNFSFHLVSRDCFFCQLRGQWVG